MSQSSYEAVQELSLPNLGDYQRQANQDWLYAHGSEEAQIHARAKLDEEIKELQEALLRKPESPDGVREVEEEMLGELGDVIWTATACASNSRIGLEAAFAEYYPKVFTAGEPVSSVDIDSVALLVLPEESDEAICQRLQQLGHDLGSNSRKWFMLGPLIELGDDKLSFADVWGRIKGRQAAEALVETVLLCSAIAQRRLGMTLEAVMVRNIQKIRERLDAGDPVTKPPRSG